MAPRERVSPPYVGPQGRVFSPRRALAFDTSQGGRDEAALLRALTKALSVLVRGAAREPALQESFVDAIAGLGAEKGVLMQGPQHHPLDVALLYARGVDSEDEAGFRALRSWPGVPPTIVRQVIQDGEARLFEGPSFTELGATSSREGPSR